MFENLKQGERVYIAIDLKSFYASVECRERGLDPLDANLVVADESRTDKTICLAATPSLKSYGISGRARLFEVIEAVKEANVKRLRDAPNRKFTGSSCFNSELLKNPGYAIDFLIAPPRMAYYINYSAKIYSIYLKYIAPEDIIVYSIDEVFMDATNYLALYKLTPRQLAIKIIKDVLNSTGVTAAAGIGTNLYLSKVAMDIVAKHSPADKDGVRIAELDEKSYRKLLWNHTPITDFWRIGGGYSKKLQKYGMFTMGDVALCSVVNEDLLYKLFGKNAELLIDHAWGWEPVTIADVKAYKPSKNSISSGQVLKKPYSWESASLVLREMADSLALTLVDKSLVTDKITVTVGYDAGNISDKENYRGDSATDRYGRTVPKRSHGTENLEFKTSSSKKIAEAAEKLFLRIVDKNLTIRRLNITAANVISEFSPECREDFIQLDFFTDYKAKEEEKSRLEREKKMQETMLEIKKKYGKNAILKGLDLEKDATLRERNEQIGGHKAY